MSLVFGLSVAVVVIWWRNHDILRDVFDYAIIISAAGKIESDLKPYTGVRSPMQSSVYVFNWAVEQLFGPTYLGLTLGGLIQALGGGFLVGWMLRGVFGVVGATLITAAVVMAGLLQHVAFFYNPLGILCYGLVVIGLAKRPDLWPIRSFDTVIIYAALVVGGINKINFQALTLFTAGLLVLRPWVAGEGALSVCLRNVVLLGLAGLVVPIGAELVWTGATFSEWFAQVLGLPSVRRDYLHHLLDLGIYLRPVHDFHHHILFNPMGGFGAGLLLVVGGWLLITGWNGRKQWLEWAFRLGLVLTGLLSGAVLMITNHETVMLTSLTYLLAAVAWLIVYRRPGMAGDGWIRRTIVAASLMWVVCGGYAAWHGSRVLYAQNPPPRSDYVRLVDAPRSMAYFEGVRMEKGGLAALRALAARLESFENEKGELPTLLFGPALEWMERSHPEAMVPHAPIWYHAGTSLTEQDEPYLKGLLTAHGEGRLVTHVTWQAWPASIRAMLARDYRAETVGERYVIYHPRKATPPPAREQTRTETSVVTPAEFRQETMSNVFLPVTVPDSGMGLEEGKHGEFFGRRGDSVWVWPFGSFAVEGRAVARLIHSVREPATVTFRVIAGDPEQGEVLWETPVVLGAGREEIEVPFSLSPKGRPLYLQVSAGSAAAGVIAAGWRQMRITDSGALDNKPPLPFNAGLKKMARSGGNESESGYWFGRDAAAIRSDGWTQVPAENWRLMAKTGYRFKAVLELEINPADPGDPVVVTLAWYRTGRFEIATREMVDLRQTKTVVLEGRLPDSTGWLGVLTRPAGGAGAGHACRIVSWEILP